MKRSQREMLDAALDGLERVFAEEMNAGSDEALGENR
jgi:hypothetical protein